MQRIRTISTLIILFLAVTCYGQTPVSDIPTVFLIGEYEAPYEAMVKDHTELLLSVSDNSMEKAYDRWLHLLQSMEEHADDTGFDIKGIKIWLNVFWKKDGRLNHIVYYPKPNSRNLDFDKLTVFLDGFFQAYQMEVLSDSGFSHYGSASFPTYSKNRLAKEK